MTINDFKDWLLAADQLGVHIIIGPKPNQPQIRITLENVDELVKLGILKIKDREAV